MQLLIATTNPGKVREYQQLLNGLPCELMSLVEVGITQEVAETGSTYEENAVLKAREYAALSHLLTLADDSGLEVDALSGRPGVQSARYAPDSPTRIQKLLAEMQHIPAAQRGARFQCVIALARPNGSWETTQGICEGQITTEARGTHGFGFDPVFHVTEYDLTMAELPEEIKNQISHRARAAEKMRPVLERMLRGA
ncbi:XTP/dITP diphosphohydrolase [Thermoflexales bacterium]|jgi:XTP/dITP diphosphohydrolase|nr:XTP/dITP diphosphohydrolase [Thermoflexales bacterium]